MWGTVASPLKSTPVPTLITTHPASPNRSNARDQPRSSDRPRRPTSRPRAAETRVVCLAATARPGAPSAGRCRLVGALLRGRVRRRGRRVGPICAGWPILSERRGLERSRRLRCGRCAGDWEVERLRCIYCGEREHERLGSLVLEDRGERLKVETCASCRGYLKSVATLQG